MKTSLLIDIHMTFDYFKKPFSVSGLNREKPKTAYFELVISQLHKVFS